MIGVVVPAHNEQACLDACLLALRAAAAHPALHGEPVHIVVVLDTCSDGSAQIVERHAARAVVTTPASGGGAAPIPGADSLAPTSAPIHLAAPAAPTEAADSSESTEPAESSDAAQGAPLCGPRIVSLPLQARNVGVARAAGAALLLAQGARWLAFTDADTRVSPAWLATQLSLGSDAVCGSIAVDDWSPHPQHGAQLAAHFADTYTDADGHGHIHGANLGVSADAYTRAGGFPPLACSEDVALVQALQRSGARIAWSAAPRVATSARRDARARGGFGDTLLAVAASMAASALPLLIPTPTDPI